MDTIDLSNWSNFKKEACQLRADLLTFVDEGDKVVGNTSISDDEKKRQVFTLMGKYLPS